MALLPLFVPVLMSTMALIVAPGQCFPVKMNLSTWMTDNHNKLRDIPLIDLAIPGSHNSGAYWLDEHGALASDQPGLLKFYILFIPKLRQIVRNYALTQSLDVLGQLKKGVRHLDIRVAMHEGEFHVYHGFYGHLLTSVLQQVNDFLVTNRHAVIFLGINRCLDCSSDDITELGHIINDVFTGKIFQMPSKDPFKTTLNDLRIIGKQLIVFFDAPGHSFPFWPQDSVYSPYNDVLTPDLLIAELDDMVPVPRKFNNYQAILSPDKDYVLSNSNGSLKELAEIANPVVADWLDGKISRCKAGIPANHKMTMLWIDFVGDVNEIESKVIWLNKINQCNGFSRH